MMPDPKSLDLPTLRITTDRVYAPWTYACAYRSQLSPSFRCPFPGFGAEIVGVLLRSGNVPFSLREYRQENAIKLISKTMNASSMMGPQIINDFAESFNIHTTATLHPYTSAYVKHLHSSFPMPGMGIGFSALVSSRTQRLDVWEAAFEFVRVYDSSSWLLIISLLAALQIHVFISNRFRSTPNTNSYFGTKFIPCWMLFFLSLFIGLWRCGLLAVLYQRPTQELFSNFEELVERVNAEQVRIITNGWGLITRKLLEEKGNILHNQTFTRNPIEYVFDEHDAVRMVQSGRYVYVDDDKYVAVLASKYCSLQTVALPDFAHIPLVMLFVRSTDLRIIEAINEAIIYAGPIIQGIAVRYERFLQRKHFKRCDDLDNSTESLAVIGLSNIFGVFLLIGMGYVFGCLLLLLEHFVKRTCDVELGTQPTSDGTKAARRLVQAMTMNF